MNTDTLRQKTHRIFTSYGVVKASVFGSYARGEQTNDSDIDILVKLGKELSLFDYIGLKQDLEDSLCLKVDLVQYDRVKPSLQSAIFQDEKIFFTT